MSYKLAKHYTRHGAPIKAKKKKKEKRKQKKKENNPTKNKNKNKWNEIKNNKQSLDLIER